MREVTSSLLNEEIKLKLFDSSHSHALTNENLWRSKNQHLQNRDKLRRRTKVRGKMSPATILAKLNI